MVAGSDDRCGTARLVDASTWGAGLSCRRPIRISRRDAAMSACPDGFSGTHQHRSGMTLFLIAGEEVGTKAIVLGASLMGQSKIWRRPVTFWLNRRQRPWRNVGPNEPVPLRTGCSTFPPPFPRIAALWCVAFARPRILHCGQARYRSGIIDSPDFTTRVAPAVARSGRPPHFAIVD